MLLRTVPVRGDSGSVEWSVRMATNRSTWACTTASAKATEWMETLAEYTANPSDKRLTEILKALDEEPNVLVVFNHPLWDLYLSARKAPVFWSTISANQRQYLHALELNGLRNWEENRQCGGWPTVEHAADLRRRPPWRGAERQHQPDQRRQFH